MVILDYFQALFGITTLFEIVGYQLITYISFSRLNFLCEFAGESPSSCVLRAKSV